MPTSPNPFEYAGANDLPRDRVIDYYIEDFNYSRFIVSKRNVLLVGERGCGKSMTLIYNSWPLQRLKAQREDKAPDLRFIGVYVPCNTPLIHKHDHELLNSVYASVVSEHHLVLSLVYAFAETLNDIPDLLEGVDEAPLRERIEFIFDASLPTGIPLFQAIMDFAQRENLRTQQAMNDRASLDARFDGSLSFSSAVVPLLGVATTLPRLSSSHFMFLVDDAQDLNEDQMRSLSSWIAYRDHSLFSFKVAIANLSKAKIRTASGGAILEGHDYLRLDMAQPFQNEVSDFGRLAQQLIARRLDRFEIQASPDEFFPMSEQLQRDLAESEAAVRRKAEEIYGDDSRRIADYVYKYKRAHYFRNRPSKANRPEYSGFPTVVFLSTGVIRNLLSPCYWMFDKLVSLRSESSDTEPIQQIPPTIQSEIILARSQRLWDWLAEGIDQNIVGCTRDDAVHCHQLLDRLAEHFRDRLLNHKSEPRANSFTISGPRGALMEKVLGLTEILREAQLLYVRSGVAKERGAREWYYVPNRLLWAARGLDPHGQHARVSIPAAVLWAAAERNKPIGIQEDAPELELFHAKD